MNHYSLGDQVMAFEEALQFLRDNPPFQNLDGEILQDIRDQIITETYPRGTIIIHQDRPAGDHLRIIKKGAVKVIAHFGQDMEVVTDYRGEGEIFGFLSLLTGDQLKARVVALEDTTCYLIDRATFLQLLRTQAAFAEQLFTSLLKKYIYNPQRELGKKHLLFGGVDRLFFTTPVGQLVNKNLITASDDISIREATEIMSKNQISSLVLLDPLGLPSGIITNKDLRDKVVSKGRDPHQPVKRVQSVSLVRAEAGEHCIEALFKMIHYNIHHLLVVDQGRLKGVVTTHDLMKLQGTSPISLVREIEGQQNADGLIGLAEKIRNMVGIFLREGVKAAHIQRISTEMNDRLQRKVLELVERKQGSPPCAFCFLALESAGRQEQAYFSSQTNALVYADPVSPNRDTVSDYFKRLTGQVSETLQRLGYPLDPQGVLASNPAWCRSLQGWKQVFSSWRQKPDTRAIKQALSFLDFRPLYGDQRLAQDLRATLSNTLPGSEEFLRSLAFTILKNSPPITAFRNFVVEKEGIHRGHFDLEKKGLVPLVNIVRFFALEAGVAATSTLKRIRALKEVSPLVREYGQDLEYVFEFIAGLGLKIQEDRVRQGQEPDSFLNPDTLNTLERKALKEVFHLIAKLQGLLLEKYQPLKI